ncbi:hypothetical protein MHH81_08625 [Psychrobacillus sp. FSL H8-0484]|uniref:hypothetical protein n=1 Tax=Psychrobacillus sp. FSL H8-0484 TaxID=2921390 RepID=UPI0030F54EEE
MNVAKGEVWVYKDSKDGKNKSGIIVGNAGTTLIEVSSVSSPPKKAYDIFLESWEEIGLLKPSVAHCFKLNQFKKDDLIFKVGVLNVTDIDKISKTIKKYVIG